MVQLLWGQVVVLASWMLEPVGSAGSELPQEGQVKGSLGRWHL